MEPVVNKERVPQAAPVGEARKPSPLRVGAFKAAPGHLAAIDRVRHWTRARFKLPDDATIMVSELTCELPGCAPLETVVAFWTEADKRHHFKVFKPVAEVVEDDLPPSFMKNALAESEVFGCPCC
jgi:nitrate reductase delta subunit